MCAHKDKWVYSPEYEETAYNVIVADYGKDEDKSYAW